MRKKKNSIRKENSKLLYLFLFLFFALLTLSLAFKFTKVLERSKYDSDYPFILKVENKDKVTILYIDNRQNLGSSVELAGEGSMDIESRLGISPDAYIRGKHVDLDSLENLVFEYGSFSSNMTIVDIIRLSFASKLMKQGEAKKEVIDVSDPNEETLKHLFFDQRLVLEDKKIHIINASGVDGEGNRLARTISILGGNVILVSNDIKGQNESKILYNGEENYTLKRLERLLKFRKEKRDKDSFSDITIVIGKQSEEFIEE